MFLYLNLEISLLIWYIWLTYTGFNSHGLPLLDIAVKRQTYTSCFVGFVCLFFPSAKLRKKEKEQNEDVWFWQYLSWHLMPLLSRANGEWSQRQRNLSRQKELLRNQNKLQMHLDKWLGISPPTYQQSEAVFLLPHSSKGRTDLAWAWDAPAAWGTWVLFCKQNSIWILHAPVLAQGTILKFPPNPG